MDERRMKTELAPAWVRESRFWEGVEQEIEALDWRDLAEFLECVGDPVEARAGFYEELRERLRTFVRTRYGT